MPSRKQAGISARAQGVSCTAAFTLPTQQLGPAPAFASACRASWTCLRLRVRPTAAACAKSRYDGRFAAYTDVPGMTERGISVRVRRTSFSKSGDSSGPPRPVPACHTPCPALPCPALASRCGTTECGAAAAGTWPGARSPTSPPQPWPCSNATAGWTGAAEQTPAPWVL